MYVRQTSISNILFPFSGLIPAVIALVLLYWWLLINDLLEEINEDKKAELECLLISGGSAAARAAATEHHQAISNTGLSSTNGGRTQQGRSEVHGGVNGGVPRRDMTLV